jgi:FtsP/CotA-like multicopper oxidase with cupredoxin domain
VALGALATLGACTSAGAAVAATSEAVRRTEQARRRPGQRTVAARLLAAPATVDLGGAAVRTWAYSDTVPGPLLRATAGDVVRITVENGLPAATSVHWHGIALRNDMDGVPGMTQAAIPAGERFVYEFTAPDAGTYFYHPHSGLQPDRGLYGVLIIDDPAEPGDYDAEWVVVLDDWLDGLGHTPEDALADLRQGGASGMGGLGGMHDMGGMPGMEGVAAGASRCSHRFWAEAVTSPTRSTS